jgi:hypothetical protein
LHDRENRSFCHVGENSERIDANDDFASKMEAALANLERRSRFRSQTKKPEEDEIRTSDHVIVSLQKREALGTVVAIEERMHAAYLTYDGFPSMYDEYQPYERLRLSVGGESVELSANEIKEGKKVVNKWGETGEVSFIVEIIIRNEIRFNQLLTCFQSTGVLGHRCTDLLSTILLC